MIPRLLGKTTRESHPDLVHGALRMMRKMSPENVAQVQRGMAERPDSTSDLKTINVPTLLVTGDEDILTGPPEADLMRQNILNSEMKIICRAGHYSAWEQPAEAGRLLRQFFDSVRNIVSERSGTTLQFRPWPRAQPSILFSFPKNRCKRKGDGARQLFSLARLSADPRHRNILEQSHSTSAFSALLCCRERSRLHFPRSLTAASTRCCST
jgi:hypothetical protein